jgi:integrase
MSRCKPHHGLRARDVLPNHRLFIEGKHTTPRGRTHALKQRVVLCADPSLYEELRALARSVRDPGANLFLPASRDGKEALHALLRRLKPLLPAHLRGFTSRWLRHSHAIAAIRAGVDLVSIQRQLGHENLATTAIYLRFAGLDEGRYLAAFGAHAAAGRAFEERDCPSCGFAWRVDVQTGALDLGSRVGVALRRKLPA